MIDWLKEHKYICLLAGIIALLFGYYLYTTANSELETSVEEDWDTTVENIEDEVEIVQEELEEILVDVKGAVHKPGVYKASTGERVVDVIDRAGGITEDANAGAINFAMRVEDEMVLYVPVVGEESEGVNEISLQSSGGNDGKVNINKASTTELETLPGIGPAKAQAIIEYRETNGPYKSIEDIMSISGFGEKTFEKLKESITVK